MKDPLVNDEHLADLLVKQTVEGLDAAEARELAQLLAQHPELEADTLERTAAAVMLAGTLDANALSPALRKRLIAQGEAALLSRELSASPDSQLRALATKRVVRHSHSHWGWWVAAASIVLAIAGWWPQLAQTPTQPTLPAQMTATPTLAEKRATLLASARSLLRLDWTATKDPAAAAAHGDVVWDNATQTGYMRFAGLAPNDPAVQQYQLWIFDAERGDTYPVDGGVFDVPAGQTEVLVPINAKLKVGKPAMFAVTVERPGGVVVSARERIVVLAQVSAG
jgi:hypothetical protein